MTDLFDDRTPNSGERGGGRMPHSKRLGAQPSVGKSDSMVVKPSPAAAVAGDETMMSPPAAAAENGKTKVSNVFTVYGHEFSDGITVIADSGANGVTLSFDAETCAREIGFADPIFAIAAFTSNSVSREFDSPEGVEQARLIGCGDFYNLIVRANSQQAKSYGRYVCDSVLPGLYQQCRMTLSPETFATLMEIRWACCEDKVVIVPTGATIEAPP